MTKITYHLPRFALKREYFRFISSSLINTAPLISFNIFSLWQTDVTEFPPFWKKKLHEWRQAWNSRPRRPSHLPTTAPTPSGAPPIGPIQPGSPVSVISCIFFCVLFVPIFPPKLWSQLEPWITRRLPSCFRSWKRPYLQVRLKEHIEKHS